MIRRDGTVKLIDFGVARMGGRYARFPTDAVVGKSGYLAPEQISMQPIDARVDVFAAGILLHELCAGRRLFHGASESETHRQISRAMVEPPSTSNRDVPAALDEIALCALAREPGRRFASGHHMAAALAAVESLVDAWPPARLGELVCALSPNSPAEPNDCVPARLVVRGSVSEPVLGEVRFPELAPDDTPRHKRARRSWMMAAALAMGLVVPCLVVPRGRLQTGSAARQPERVAAVVEIAQAPVPSVGGAASTESVRGIEPSAPAVPKRATWRERGVRKPRWPKVAQASAPPSTSPVRSLKEGGLSNPFAPR
jgi:hypothetical protein